MASRGGCVELYTQKCREMSTIMLLDCALCQSSDELIPLHYCISDGCRVVYSR